MNSIVNTLSYGSCSTGGQIEPAMHVINSLGLPKKTTSSNMSSSASFFASARPTLVNNTGVPDNIMSSYRPPFHFLDSLKYNTSYSPKTSRPSSGYNFSSTKEKSSYNPIDPVGYGILKSYSQTNQSSNKQTNPSTKSDSYIDPDENNNFLRDQRGRFAQCVDRAPEGDPSERICHLAQPKRLPCEYQEDRRSVYWTSKRMRPNCGNHTHFETTARLDELALPKAITCDCVLNSQAPCEVTCYYPSQACLDEPRVIDWGRLAMPKQRCPPNFRPLQHVRKSALKAAPTKRLCKLSVPKPVIDVAKFYLWLWKKKPDKKVELTKVERLFITKCQMTDMRVMIRCDLDPCTGGGIDVKLADVIPTIKYALSKGAKSVIIVSHRDPPTCGGINEQKEVSLKPLAQRFQDLLGTPVLFLDDCVGYQAKALCRDPEPGNVFLLENLVFHAEESGHGIDEKGKPFVCTKEKIEAFRDNFFHLADTYVIDSFRELVTMTNTTVGYKSQEKAYGFKVKSELDSYNKFVFRPRQPMVAIVGGDLKDTYLIIRNLMGIATDIVIGGDTALAFLKSLKRTDTGLTNITPKMERKALNLHSRAKDTKTGLLLPSDVVVRRVSTGEYFTVLTREDIDDDYEIVDIGPFTRRCYTRVIEKAETLLWWGNMGNLGDGTNAIAVAFVEAAKRGARTFVADDGTKAAIINTTDMGRKTHVTEDSVATTMLLRGKLPKGLAVLNAARRKIKKREPAAPPISRKPIKYDVPGLEVSSGDKIMCISDIDLEGKNVLIRVDFHVPMQGNKILNNYRIRMVIPTIKYALKWKARTVVILGHIGFPDGKKEESLTLKPICDEVASLLGHTVVFVPETVGKLPESVISNAHPGTVIMVENVRFHPEETGSGTLNTGSNSLLLTNISSTQSGLIWKSTRTEATPQAIATFCEKITRLGDIYVNDAFSCLNYDHNSIMNYFLPTRVCGFLVKNELKYMARICNFPKRRILIILGGNSFKEKISILLDLLKEADDIIVVGSLAVAFLKIYLNIAIGSSLNDSSFDHDIRTIIDLADYYSCRLFYPVDLLIATSRNGDNLKQISITEQISDNQMVIDIGELTSSMFGRIIKKSQMVVWVGVAGITESEAGAKGTKKIMDAIIEITKDPEQNVISIVGGRSACEFIYRFESGHENFTHVTTGSLSAFKLLTERYLLAMDNLMPKHSKRPLRMLSVDQIDVADKRILIRADLAVPLKDGVVTNPFPLTHLVSTIKYLLKKGARSVVLLGDLGEPDGQVNMDFSLAPIKTALESLLEQEVFFADEGVSEATDAASKSRKIVLVENIKFHPEEVGIKHGPNNRRIKVSYDAMTAFRTMLTSLGDIYMNESLTTVHLNISSVVGIGNIRKVAGPNLKKNLLKFEEIKKTLERPLLMIIGSDKPLRDIPSLYRLLDLVDEIIICGSLALTILKAEGGVRLGKSFIDLAGSKFLPSVMRKAKMNKVTIHTPVDFIADEDPNEKVDVPVEETSPEDEENVPVKEEKQTLFTVTAGIPDNLLALDIGPETISIFNDVINEAKTIIFQGVISPFYMFEQYQAGSKAIFETIRTATANGIQSVAIGVSASICLSKLDALDAFTMCSNGNQVFYDMLRGRALPGLKVLEEAPGKPLKKLSIEQMDLANQRVLIRLDLFVPTVEGVVLDTDKLELAAPTILYALKKGAKSVVLLGHRGNPNGYKNTFLSMEPLVVDLSQILETTVTLITRPCGKRTKELLADPPAGSVFLMENLKFYPAEYGIDAAPREGKNKPVDVTPEGEVETEGTPPAGPPVEAPVSVEKEEEEISSTTPSIELSDGEGGKNIDSMMFQLMTPKTVTEFNTDLAACGDVFINDDVADVAENLTSIQGFGIALRGCGLQLATYISDLDDPEVYNLPGIVSLSPSPFK